MKFHVGNGILFCIFCCITARDMHMQTKLIHHQIILKRKWNELQITYLLHTRTRSFLGSSSCSYYPIFSFPIEQWNLKNSCPLLSLFLESVLPNFMKHSLWSLNKTCVRIFICTCIWMVCRVKEITSNIRQLWEWLSSLAEFIGFK